MVSPAASQGSLGEPVLLELAKYSYATLPINSVAPVPWIHISNTSSLVAYFETRRSFNSEGGIVEKSIFKVLKDPEVMEELDLHALAREARRAIDVCKDAMQHSMDQNVAVIIRAPVIAIKYPRNEREVRRFQIRFQSNESFYDAMKILSRAGVPTLEAGTFPPRRPQSTATHSSLSNPADGTHIPTGGRPATASGLGSGVSAPASFMRPSTSGSNMPSPSHFSAPVRATNTTSPFFESIQNVTAPSHHLNGSGGPARDAFSGTRQNVPSAHTDQVETPPEHVSVTPANHASVAPNVPHTFSQDPLSLISQEIPTIDLYIPRPSTAPDKQSQHLSQILPPRRELPFENKSSAQPSRKPLKELRNGRHYSVEPSSTKRNKKLDNTDVPKDPSSDAKKKRQASAKSPTKSAAPKRSRATKKSAPKAHANLASNEDRAIPPMPSLEEHLNQETLPTENTSLMKDTQTIIEMADASIAHSKIKKLTERPGLLNAEKSSISSLNSPDDGASVLVNPIGSDPPTHSTKLPVINESVEPASPDGPNPPPATDALLRDVAATAPNPILTTLNLPISITSGPSPTTNPPPPPLLGPQSLTTQFTQVYNSLLSLPPFANADSKLAEWNSQPKNLQTQALHKFYCDAYQNKNFHDLCVQIEGDWRAMIVWPEALRNPVGWGVDDGCSGMDWEMASEERKHAKDEGEEGEDTEIA